jgi:ring-1,2-phenylacetyl-CoA epoxidase subunit PaaC
VSARAQALLEYADDELVLGWRDSEWTGIAPFLEEDVAFSSIAQNEIGHARALYELAAAELGTTADELAFDRRPEEYRCSPFVEQRLVSDWGTTIARHFLYEEADRLRIEDHALWFPDPDEAVKGLVAKMDREEVYHRMHARMWAERLRDEPRFRAAVADQLPLALGMLDEALQPALIREMDAILDYDLEAVEPVERGSHLPEFTDLWEEMTAVRRSEPRAQW